MRCSPIASTSRPPRRRDARRSAELAMTQFSDTVRPGVERLSALAHPDVRLRLPRHHAIVSWVTPSGRGAGVPGRDASRCGSTPGGSPSWPRSRAARGGRRLSDLRQPHWEGSPAREPAGAARGAKSAPAATIAPSGRSTRGATVEPVSSGGRRLPPLPVAVARGFRELLDLDRARAVRGVAAPRDAKPADRARRAGHRASVAAGLARAPAEQPDPPAARAREGADDDPAAAEAAGRRRPDRAPAVPPARRRRRARCAARSLQPGWAALAVAGERSRCSRAASMQPRSTTARGLRQVRHELHVAGWALALAARGRRRRAPRTAPARCCRRHARRRGQARPFGPAELSLPGRARSARLPAHGRGAASRSRPVRDAASRCDGFGPLRRRRRCSDLLIERDDRAGRPAGSRSSSAMTTSLPVGARTPRRYGPGGRARPLVGVRRAATGGGRGNARAGPTASCARAGPTRATTRRTGSYLGRLGTVFVAERDIHEGELCGWSVPALPPELRSTLADGDPRAAEERALGVMLPAHVA